VLGDTGKSYPKNDFEQLTQRMQELINSSEQEREDLRRRAQARAEQHYSWEKVTDQYLELFKELCFSDKKS